MLLLLLVLRITGEAWSDGRCWSHRMQGKGLESRGQIRIRPAPCGWSIPEQTAGDSVRADLSSGRSASYMQAKYGETCERGRIMIRRTYIRKVEDRLERLENKIDHFRNQMTTPVGDIRDRIEQKTRDLRAKTEIVRKRIRAVEAAEASSWGRLKSAVDEGLKELGQVVDEAVERFRKTGSGD